MWSKNPWNEAESGIRINQVRRDIELSRRICERASEELKLIRSDLQRFEKSLCDIQSHLTSFPDDWRRIRAVIVVDIPAVSEALEGALSLPDGDARSELLSYIPRAVQSSRTAADSLATARAEELAIGLQVLPSSMAVGDSSHGDRSLLGRARGLGFGAGSRIVGASVDVSRNAAESLAEKAGAVAALSTEHIGSLAGSVGRTVTRPVALRMQAMSDAVGEVSMAAFIVGGIVSVVFPPIAPLVVGEAFLRLPDAYAANLSGLSEEEARAELIRSGEKADRIASIMAVIKGGPIRFDTPCVSITVNPKCGTASGIILAGKYTGEAMENLDADVVKLLHDKAPDEETKRALNSWILRSA